MDEEALNTSVRAPVAASHEARRRELTHCGCGVKKHGAVQQGFLDG